MSKFKRLVNPLIELAKKNKPEQFKQNDLIDMALFSEAGLAEYIAAGLEGRLLWCEPKGWLVYDESNGTFTGNFAEDVIYELIKFYRDKILSFIGQTDPQNNQNIAFNFYKSLLNASTTRAIISLMKHEPNVAALPMDFDADPNLLNCCGYVVSVSGEVRGASPADRFTQTTICKPEKGTPENFLRHIEWTSKGDTALIRWKLAAYGSALFGCPSDKIINCHGHGGNGKGAELRPIYNVFGTYATVLPRSLAIKEPGVTSRFDREGLVGKRLAVLFDLKVEKGKLNLDDLKTICGNGDPQSVEPKGKPRYDAVINSKVFLASNDQIPTDSYGPSEKRRFYLVPYNNRIEEKDETLEERFKPEYGKILYLLLESASEYFRNNRKMPVCTAIDRATAEYFDSQDIVGQFLSDCCVQGEVRISKKELFSIYEQYLFREHGILKPGNLRNFAVLLEKRGIFEGVKKIDGKTARIFEGVNLLESYKVTKKPEFQVTLPIEPAKESNLNFENSCNFVTEKPKTATQIPLELPL